MAKVRLYQLVVTRGLAPTRARAQALVLAGEVYVRGARVDKVGTLVAPDAEVEVRTSRNPYVSRGGIKLAGALDAFGLDPRGLRCLDLGASTGGFTDCLLQRGAARVVAVDVGYGQLAQKLRDDPRVVVMERTNARDLDAPDVMKEIVERFHRRHEELYTYATPDQEVVLVNARLAVVGELPALPEEPALPARLPAAPRGRRRAYFGPAGGWYDVPVYDLDGAAPGQVVTGPALLEAATTTVLVGTGERAVVTPLGWLDISV